MPKEIKDLKDFVKIIRKESKNLPKAKKIIIKKNKGNVTKFKLRTPKQLITYKAVGADRAEKLKQSIPADLQKVQIHKKRLAGNQ